MYKVKYVATGIILWYKNTIVGIVGVTLPEMFEDCDCYKLPGNPFDYALADQEFTEEQKAFLNRPEPDGEEPVDPAEVEEWKSESNYDLPDDDLPF